MVIVTKDAAGIVRRVVVRDPSTCTILMFAIGELIGAERSPFALGSIVRRRLRGLLGLLFWHSGIYIGKGLVVHFDGEPKNYRCATVRIDELATFACGGPVQLHNVPRSMQHGTAVCAKALAFAAMPANRFNGNYDVLLLNCDDFVGECWTVNY